MHTPLSILNDTGILNWGTLLVGFNQGWVTNAEVISFAINWLVEHPNETEKAVIELAGAKDGADQEIRSLIADVAGLKSGFTETDDAKYLSELDKWRYAHLKCLKESGMSDAMKLEELQRIYAEFGYPADMAACSKFGPSDYAIRHGFAIEEPDGPLAAMEKVLDDLGRRLSIAR